MRKLIFFLFLAVIGANAQQTESLKIGPGDMLHIQVFDTPELEQHARVTDAGELPLLLGGSVKLADLTPAEAARMIEKRLLAGHYMLRPQVSVTVDEYATQKVSVLGEVKAPGAYAINTPRSVLEVLTMAGGLSDQADRKILIERRGTKNVKIPYFVSNKPDVAMDTSVRINPGDTIYVVKAGIVYVLGDVGRPGGYVLNNNEGQLSVLQLVARAGGTNHSAVPSHAKLMRKTNTGYTENALPLSAMQKGKQPDQMLVADDIIYVPFSYLRNAAMSAAGLTSAVASAAIYQF
jgi:polysaccharide biosynthesis/export protein